MLGNCAWTELHANRMVFTKGGLALGIVTNAQVETNIDGGLSGTLTIQSQEAALMHEHTSQHGIISADGVVENLERDLKYARKQAKRARKAEKQKKAKERQLTERRELALQTFEVQTRTAGDPEVRILAAEKLLQYNA